MSRRRNVHKRQLAAVLLLVCLFAQTMGHARSASITFDEGPHLAVGYATLRTGDLRLQPIHIHPPLANVLAAAPLLLQTDLPDPRSIGGWEIASLSAISDGVVWQYPHPRRLAVASRFPIILMTLLLGAVVFRWASDLFGPKAGLLALFLYAFDPNVIAHGSLVTTDMAVVLWGTTALFLTGRYLRHARRRYLVGAGIVLGLGLASKVSAVSLLPPVGLLLLLGPRSLPWRRRFLAAVGCLALTALTLWAAYGFELGPLPDFALPVPAATHLKIYRSLQEHYQLGHPSFLMGQNSDHGWWYYFPVAFVLKTPLPTLLLLVAASLQVCKSARGQVGRAVQFSHKMLEPPSRGRPMQRHDISGKGFRPQNAPGTGAESTGANLRIRDLQRIARRWGPLLLYPILYAASSLFSSVDIGYRHLLPILPFLFIFISRIANSEWRMANRISRFAFYVLLVCYLAGTLRVFPQYLSYFNLLAGGPAGGYRYLVDSNLDWGQNMWQLRDWMQENDVERVYYAHFSPDRPQVYGIEADFLPPDPRAVKFAPFDPAPGVYAIGATVLQGVYTPDVNTYAWFRSHEPLLRLGHALFVYDVPPRPSPAWVAVCAAPVPVLSPEVVRTRFGNPDLRVILLDCGQSWIYPSGGEPGGYVLPPDAEPPSGAMLEAAARHPDGNPFYDLYRLGGERPTPKHPAEGVRINSIRKLDGPLAFLGYQVDMTGVRTGSVRTGSVRTGSVRTGSVRTESVRTESVRTESVRTESVHPGDTVELWTFWKVRELPGRLFSLMAHLLGPDGTPIAVGDGLGVPVHQWQSGDVIIQRHRLRVPEGTVAGEYSLQTGGYWLDTMERWPVHLADGTVSDHLAVGKIVIRE